METRVTVTPWRDREELLDVRRHLFGEDIDARERAVDKVRNAHSTSEDFGVLTMECRYAHGGYGNMNCHSCSSRRRISCTR
jgi:hypothetical protein